MQYLADISMFEDLCGSAYTSDLTVFNWQSPIQISDKALKFIKQAYPTVWKKIKDDIPRAKQELYQITSDAYDRLKNSQTGKSVWKNGGKQLWDMVRWIVQTFVKFKLIDDVAIAKTLKYGVGGSYPYWKKAIQYAQKGAPSIRQKDWDTAKHYAKQMGRASWNGTVKLARGAGKGIYHGVRLPFISQEKLNDEIEEATHDANRIAEKLIEKHILKRYKAQFGTRPQSVNDAIEALIAELKRNKPQDVEKSRLPNYKAIQDDYNNGQLTDTDKSKAYFSLLLRNRYNRNKYNQNKVYDDVEG